MKYLISILFISATVLMAGCIATQPIDDANTNLNQADSAGVTNTTSETNSNDSATTTETINTNETATVGDTDTASDTIGNTNENVATDVDISNWLTYTNEEYGFSFRYPEDWNFEVLKEGGLGTDIGDINLNDGNCNILITVPHEKDDQERFVNMYNDSLNSGEFGTEPVESVLIGEIQSIKYLDPKFAYERKGEIYKFVIKNKIFSYALGYIDASEDCVMTSNNILSSFKNSF